MEPIDFAQAHTFSVDTQRRTITGVVMPWGKIGRHSNGQKWIFERGSLVYGHVKFLRLNDEHDNAQRIGRAVDAQDTDEGLVVTFKINPGEAGDRALANAQSGQRRGLSVETEIDIVDAGPHPEHFGVTRVTLANFTGVGLVSNPAFTDSRIIRVVASYDPEGTGMPPEDTTTTTQPANQPDTQPTPQPQPQPNPQPQPEPAPQAVTFSSDQFAQFLSSVGLGAPAGRPVVNPAARPAPNAQVDEPLPYRFSRNAGRTVFAGDAEHDFSTDLFAIVRARTEGRAAPDAEARVNGMIAAAFAADNTTSINFDVDRADISATTPNRHRPDLWQPQMDYVTPLWDMINAGTTDGRSFDVPKFNSSSGLVVPATEGVEPAPGAFSATLQTITPTQVWGKVEVTRQAWRAGGSPQLSGILWDQMLREYYEDRENAVATFLNTLTAATDITLTGTPATTPDNDDDQQTVTDLEAAITDLQFVRGGNRFRAFVVQQNLYRVLARVKDDAGRPLYPQLNPANSNGTAQALWRYLNVGGTTAVPAWALGAGGGTAASNSWLFDPSRTLGWASAPERMFWDFGATVQTANIPQLSHVTLGIYGDVAFANLDIAAVRQVIFDPSV